MLKLQPIAANAQTDAVTALLNDGYLDILDNRGHLLATLGFSSVAFSSAVNGTASANPLKPDADAKAAGTASSFRCTTKERVAVCEGSVGSYGADLNLNSVEIQQHAEVKIGRFTLVGKR